MTDFWGLPDPAPPRDRWAHISEAAFRARIQRVRDFLDEYEQELRHTEGAARVPAIDEGVDAARWQDRAAENHGGA